MSAQLLDGKSLSKTVREQLKASFSEFAAKNGAAPTLAVVRVGMPGGGEVLLSGWKAAL